MATSIFTGGFLGMVFGALVGWVTFGNAINGITIGISFSMAVCGALVAYEYARPK